MVGAVITTFSYVAVGIPLAALLAFTGDFGLNGIWWGNAMALTLAGVLTLAYMFFRMDWVNLVRFTT